MGFLKAAQLSARGNCPPIKAECWGQFDGQITGFVGFFEYWTIKSPDREGAGLCSALDVSPFPRRKLWCGRPISGPWPIAHRIKKLFAFILPLSQYPRGAQVLHLEPQKYSIVTRVLMMINFYFQKTLILTGDTESRNTRKTRRYLWLARKVLFSLVCLLVVYCLYESASVNHNFMRLPNVERIICFSLSDNGFSRKSSHSSCDEA